MNKKKNTKKILPIEGRSVVYHMSYQMFNSINATRDEDEKKSPKQYVLNIINKEFPVKGHISNIVLHERL